MSDKPKADAAKTDAKKPGVHNSAKTDARAPTHARRDIDAAHRFPTPSLPAQDAKPAEKRKPDYEVYEEDDEFEEFAQDNWDAAAEDAEDPKLWQDDWDDDDVDDDFCRHLREELQKPVEKN